MNHNKVKNKPVRPVEKSQLINNLTGQKILAVCEHFSFNPLISFEGLNISNHRDGNGFFDRYFTRYIAALPFEEYFPDEAFDLVICDNSYQDFKNFEALADEIYRLLKVGGFCYFSGYGLFSPGRNKAISNDRYYLTKRNLRRKLSNFWIHDYTPLIKENPAIFNIDIISPPEEKNFINRFSGWFFSSFFDEFVWVLTKKK